MNMQSFEFRYLTQLERLLERRELEIILLMLVPLRPRNNMYTPMVYDSFEAFSGLRNLLAQWPKVLPNESPDTYQLIRRDFLDAIDRQTVFQGISPHYARDFLSLVQRKIDQMAVDDPKWKKPLVEISEITVKVKQLCGQIIFEKFQNKLLYVTAAVGFGKWEEISQSLGVRLFSSNSNSIWVGWLNLLLVSEWV